MLIPALPAFVLNSIYPGTFNSLLVKFGAARLAQAIHSNFIAP
jgi:hypothetical protein